MKTLPTRPLVLLLALPALLALAACGVSEDREAQIGQQTMQRMQGSLPVITDPVIADFVTELGLAMARRTSRPDLDWRFFVVNDPQVNAFALPGGIIYVNRGLIDRADRLDELAGVIGHEIGHVVQRHAVSQMEKAQGANAIVSTVCEYTSWCDNQTTQAAIDVGAAALFARYSRHDEAEADSEAVYNVMRAGIDPEGIPAMFENLLVARRRAPSTLDEFFASHPLEEDRIRHTDRLLDAIPPESLEGMLQDTPQFHAFKARLAMMPPPPPVRRAPQQIP